MFPDETNRFMVLCGNDVDVLLLLFFIYFKLVHESAPFVRWRFLIFVCDFYAVEPASLHRRAFCLTLKVYLLYCGLFFLSCRGWVRKPSMSQGRRRPEQVGQDC